MQESTLDGFHGRAECSRAEPLWF